MAEIFLIKGEKKRIVGLKGNLHGPFCNLYNFQYKNNVLVFKKKHKS
jgi:uncharacterized membrane protein